MRRWISQAAAVLGSGAKPCLLREHLHRVLYDTADGYFSRSATPVGVLDTPIPYPKLADFAHYQAAVRQAYQALQVSWLTPSELFSPYWGQAVARCILGARSSCQPLRIFEIGAGSGTQARDILDYVRSNHPEVYADMQYSAVEISPALGQLQQRRVLEEAGHAARFTVDVRDAGIRSNWGQPDPRPCTILMMEVLDNCPHDKVVREAEGHPWQQVVVGQRAQQGLTELRQHLTDPLIARCLGIGGWRPPPRSVWRRIADALAQADEGAEMYLPTASMQLLETFAHALPNHQLIVADFDALPDVQLPGTNAPLVAATEAGQTIDFDSYLLPPGVADVLFPTNFAQLERMYRHIAASTGAKVSAEHLKTAGFMSRHADLKALTTRSGFCPATQDFTNSSIMIGSMEA